MRSKAICALFTVFIGILPSLSVANEAIEAAEYAVRQLIRGKMGSQYRVAFDHSTDEFLSFSESVVTGSGHIYEGNRWDFDRSFSFKIKVRVDGTSTRELAVTFTNGERQTDSSGWTPSKHKEQSVHLLSPRWYENLGSGDVVFEGLAQSPITIQVFDPSNRQVAGEVASPRNGRFRVVISLPNGSYRALLTPGGWEIADEVRFSVKSSVSPDWGRPAPYLKVAEPGRDVRVSDSRVTFSGNSSDRSVYLQVWDDRNNRVVDRDIPVKDRYWNSQVVMNDGYYRFTITSGTSSETRNFIVDSGRAKPKPQANPQPGSVTVRIYEPRRESTLTGYRNSISGSCPDSAVLVQLFDDRGGKRFEQRVMTNRGSWSAMVPMSPGRYRLRVTGHSGANFDEVWFSVR